MASTKDILMNAKSDLTAEQYAVFKACITGKRNVFCKGAGRSVTGIWDRSDKNTGFMIPGFCLLLAGFG